MKLQHGAGNLGTWVVSRNSAFLRCMAARGDAVAPAPEHFAPYPGHAYLLEYPYGYFDPPYGAFDPAPEPAGRND